MKFAKYLMLVFVFCACTGSTKAQTVAFLGGGSSALFQELGAATQSIPGISCLWSFGSTTTPGGTPYIAAHDGRTGVNDDENGKFFVAWGPGTGSCASPAGSWSIYAYIQLDSVVGDRCYFENDGSGSSGCTLILQNTGIAGTSQITTTPDKPLATALPTAVSNALLGAPHFFVAGTDIRPEDAKFATQRAFTPCNQYMPRQYFNQDSYYLFGLGYGTGNIGTAIQGNASYGGGNFGVYNFNVTGNDPISGAAVPAYSVSTIGAQPIVVAVAPANTGNGNIAAMTDITAATLSLFYEGVLGRTSDLLGPTGGAEAFTTLVREPLSGTYNTFEYSIPQSTQFHAGQDFGNCTGGGAVLSNPMALNNGNGVFGTASQRVRVIGTGNMTKFLQQATTPTLGYFFWSAGNAKNLTNVKYLKVNGVDPLLDTATAYNGVLPNSGATFATDPGLAHVGFAGLNAGDYPIWSALRLVGPPGNAGVAAMITALATLDSSQKDYIPPSSMNIWHSHFFLNGQSAIGANGTTVGSSTLCSGGIAEGGGDAGGSTLLIINNAHFCSDYGNTGGLVNKTF